MYIVSQKFSASALLLSALLVLQFVLLNLPTSAGGAVAIAQEEEKDSKRPFKGKKVQKLSASIGKIVNRANELLAEGNNAGARAEIDKAAAKPDLTPYDIAQIYSFYGFLNFEAERYKTAISDFNRVLQQPELPEALKQQAYRALAQLSFVTEDFDGALRYADGYLKEVGPDATMYVVKGTAYYEKGQYNNMIAPIQSAIDMTRAAGGQTKEMWWQLLRVAHWENKNYRKVKDVMEVLVSNWPKKEYWLQLSAVYSELDDEVRQLAAYEAAYDQGMLESGNELLTLGQLMMQGGAPYKGAKVISSGFESGKIERNVRNLRTLAQAWQMAAEDQKAIAPLKSAAGLSSDGELYARLARSHLNLSQYRGLR